MKKIYKPLTDDQIRRGVIFSSQLIPNGKLFEIDKKNSNGYKKKLLLDDKFFDNSPYEYNEIHTDELTKQRI